jgi:hypothetical protein
MAFDHKTGELRDLQQLDLCLLKTFSALYSTRVFEIIDLAQDPDFPFFAALLPPLWLLPFPPFRFFFPLLLFPLLKNLCIQDLGLKRI